MGSPVVNIIAVYQRIGYLVSSYGRALILENPSLRSRVTHLAVTLEEDGRPTKDLLRNSARCYMSCLRLYEPGSYSALRFALG